MIVRRAAAVVLCAASLTIAAPALAGSNLDAARDLVNKGNYLMASGKYPEALEIYAKAQKYEPSNVIIRDNIGKVYNNWAISLTKQKKYGEALEKLNKCLEVVPGYGQARRNIALLKQMALDEGVDLDAPPEPPGGAAGAGGGQLPDGGWLPGYEPKSGAAIKPGGTGAAGAVPGGAGPGAAGGAPGGSGTTVSGATITGTSANGASIFAGGTTAGTAALAPKVAPVQPDAGAVLFIGGVRQEPSGDSAAPGASVVTPPAVPVVPNVTPVTTTPPAVSPPATFVQKNVNPMFPSTPQMYPPDAVHTAAPPAVPVSAAPPAVPVVSFDDQLTAVEMKVYGAKQTNLTVLQRLEKIERDSQGQVRGGTILERINYLKSSYGL